MIKLLTSVAECMNYPVPQAIDLKEFMKAFDMPDTFFSWFLVTELHVWLLGARLMQVHWRVGWLLYCRDPFCSVPSVLLDLLVSSSINLKLSGRREMLEG